MTSVQYATVQVARYSTSRSQIVTESTGRMEAPMRFLAAIGALAIVSALAVPCFSWSERRL
jgi:hypothetical protein